jgi:hypothetical protein
VVAGASNPFFGAASWNAPIGWIEAKIPPAAGGIRPPNFSDVPAPTPRIQAEPRCERIGGRRREASTFIVVIAAQFPAHREPTDRVLTVSPQQTLRLLEFQAMDAAPKGRRPAATKSRSMELPISHILTKSGEVAERLKAAVC